ncbi:MAG TPA: hypothetical protein VEQ63_07190 [Bryobacteraceae bacterium]|nr:hypothetical protein [Bryobacteraceae bacterium]
MVHRLLISSAALTGILLADSVVLRSGRTIEGQFLGGDSRTIRFDNGQRVETINLQDVSTIRFGSEPAPAAAKPKSSTPAAAASAAPRQRAEIMRPSGEATTPERPAARKTLNVEIPAGTVLAIRMIDDVDSERDQIGQTFRASIDEPVVVGERTVIPRGADVLAKLVSDREAGKLSGRTELTLDLVQVQLDGRMVDVLSQEVTTQGESRTGRTAKVVGGTAALGAIIGAIAGGGKGAAIGAVSGAAAGGAVQVLTKGPTVKIPSEARLSFTLQQPLRP